MSFKYQQSPRFALACVIFLACGRLPAAEKKITVAADGSGDFKTVQEAFDAVPEKSADRTLIRIKPGTYEGQKILAKGKDKVSLLGVDAASTILTWNINTNEEQPAGTNPRFKGTGLVILGDDFKADKLTFENASGDHGQALALRLDGDRAVVTNCRMLGWQDTLRPEKGRHYFKDCYIEGRVDFIYGGGTAVFDQCEIKSKNGGYITAASTPQEQPYGFVFFNCKLTSDPAPWVDPNGKITEKPSKKSPLTYLGRPWRPYASVIFLNCRMGDHIRPEGWDNWGNAANEETARYAEANSTGPGADHRGRVKWSQQLDKAAASKITIDAVLSGEDRWKPN
jgi:pectinesterase